MSTGLPWFKFDVVAYLGDQNLRRCSEGARGVWVDCLCLMHHADPRGYLIIDGRRMENQELITELADICRVPPHVLLAYLEELERRNVFSRDRSGTIYSRRMVRDTALDKARSKGGKRGGAIMRERLRNNGQTEPAPAVRYKTQTQMEEKDVRLGVSDIPSPTHKNRSHSRATVKIEDWEISQDLITWAHDKGLTTTQAEDQAEQFQNHALAHGRKLKNADAAFRQWVLKAIREGWVEPAPSTAKAPPEPPRMYLHHRDGGMEEIYSPEPEHTPWKVFRTDPDGTVHYHNPSDRPPINTPDDDGE